MAVSAVIHVALQGQFGYHNAYIHTSKVLGSGTYGSVVKATLDTLPCAAKILHATFFQSNPEVVAFVIRSIKREYDIIRELRHPCIVQFLGVVQHPNQCSPIFLMELMNETLSCFLEQAETSLPYHTQMNITYDVAQAIAYLHHNSIIHRDLSSNNVLLKGGTQAKVTDFGMSKMVDVNPSMTRSQITQCLGTPAFMPPEALRRTKPRYSDKLDTFSLGVLMVQIITRTFPAPTDAEIVTEDDTAPTGEKVIAVPEIERRKNDIAKVPSDHALLPIALCCLRDRDRERPTAAQLCQRLEQLKGTPASLAIERMKLEEKEESMEISQPMREPVPEKGMQQQIKEEVVNFSKAAPTHGLPAQGDIMAKSISKPDEKALYDAVERGDVSTVRQLVASNVNIDCMPHQDGWTALMEASFEGRADIVRILIEAKAQINTQNVEGETALHLAAGEGKVDVVRLLTQAQAEVNMQTEDSRTALYIASWKGHVEVVKLLIQQHAGVHICGKNGWAPLMTASHGGHVDIVRTLIEARAQINTQDENGKTALHLSAQEAKVDVVRLLTEAQAQVNIQAKDGKTTLFIASQKGHGAVAKLLLQQRADVNICRKDGATPLMEASLQGHVDIVRKLIEAKAQINTQEENGITALHVAALAGNTDVVRQLTEAQAQVNIQTEDGKSPLFIASRNGNSDVVNILVRNGADVNTTDDDGATPLYIASLKGHSDVVSTLTRNGADINLSFMGQKPIDIARSEGHTAIVRLLRRHGN